MNNCIRMTHAHPVSLFALVALLLGFTQSSAQAAPQHGTDRKGMEVFEEIDPYTKNDKEKIAALGYERFGPFGWTKGYTTTSLQEMLGGTPMIWVETAHFKIGSSLTTYKLLGDKAEKERLKEELARLKGKLGKFKAPKNEIDPWLRLHLYAQRAEECYAQFVEDFQLSPSDFDEKSPYLGNPNKFLVLLCQRKSELSRYSKVVHDQVQDTVFRWGMYRDSMLVGASYEAIQENYVGADDQPFDAILHCQLVASLVSNFVDGFQGNLYQSPRWFGNVLGHLYVRRIDARWMTARGHKANDPFKEDGWKWEPVIMKLVKNKFFATTEQMFAWEKYEDMNKRDHMIAWSKMEYLMTVAEGDRKCWVEAMCRKGKEEGVKEELLARQTRALLGCFELSPEELDVAWAKWVKKAYKKRK